MSYVVLSRGLGPNEFICERHDNWLNFSCSRSAWIKKRTGVSKQLSSIHDALGKIPKLSGCRKRFQDNSMTCEE